MLDQDIPSPTSPALLDHQPKHSVHRHLSSPHSLIGYVSSCFLPFPSSLPSQCFFPSLVLVLGLDIWPTGSAIPSRGQHTSFVFGGLNPSTSTCSFWPLPLPDRLHALAFLPFRTIFPLSCELEFSHSVCVKAAESLHHWLFIHALRNSATFAAQNNKLLRESTSSNVLVLRRFTINHPLSIHVPIIQRFLFALSFLEDIQACSLDQEKKPASHQPGTPQWLYPHILSRSVFMCLRLCFNPFCHFLLPLPPSLPSTAANIASDLYRLSVNIHTNTHAPSL